MGPIAPHLSAKGLAWDVSRDSIVGLSTEHGDSMEFLMFFLIYIAIHGKSRKVVSGKLIWLLNMAIYS